MDIVSVLGYLAAFILGGLFGFVSIGLCIAAKDNDRGEDL